MTQPQTDGIGSPQPSMMFIRVAAATQRLRLAEKRPGMEKYTNWWVAQVLDAIEAEGYAVVREWDLANIEQAMRGIHCTQTEEF